MPEWYVAKVKSSNDQSLEGYLRGRGVAVYSPEIVVMKRGKQWTERLFPGYLFVMTDPTSEDWPLIRWARGLNYFLPTSMQPAPLPENVIEDISSRVRLWNGGGWIEAFQAGDRVTIDSGPLKPLDAVFERYLPAKQRCDVIVSLFGGPRRIEVEITSIQSAVASRRFVQDGGITHP